MTATRVLRVAPLALALAAVAAACNPILVAESPAPPGRSARLDPVEGFWAVKSYRLELSQGAAIAVSCSRGASCEHMTVTSDNPAIAEVRPASLGVLRANTYGYGAGAQPAAVVVIVGKAAGTTQLHVHAEQGDRDVAVTIIPQPAPAPTVAPVHAAQAAAR